MIDDTRTQHVVDHCDAALKLPVTQCLDDAREVIVNIVEDGLATLPAADLNQLDAARWYINRAIALHRALVDCVEDAQKRMAMVMSNNVVELRPTTPGGAA